MLVLVEVEDVEVVDVTILSPFNPNSEPNHLKYLTPEIKRCYGSSIQRGNLSMLINPSTVVALQNTR